VPKRRNYYRLAPATGICRILAEQGLYAAQGRRRDAGHRINSKPNVLRFASAHGSRGGGRAVRVATAGGAVSPVAVYVLATVAVPDDLHQ